jgi:hypothetical protein
VWGRDTGGVFETMVDPLFWGRLELFERVIKDMDDGSGGWGVDYGQNFKAHMGWYGMH